MPEYKVTRNLPIPISPNGVRWPAAATFPEPLVEVTFFSRLVMATLLSRALKIGFAHASVDKARRLRIWLNMVIVV
jgi:hypothetical protein